jgi:hypothetical protein
MQIDCLEIIGKFIDDLEGSFRVEKLSKDEQACLIYTPFTGFNLEPFYVYVEDIGSGRINLTDAGDIINYLELFEINLKLEANELIFNRILKTYNLKFYEDNKEVYIETNPKNVGRDLRNFLMGIQALSHLEYRIEGTRKGPFHSQVREYLYESGLRGKFLNNQKIKGYRIDMTSKNKKTLLQTFGTETTKSPSIVAYTIRKLYPYLDFRLSNGQDLKMYSVYDESLTKSRKAIKELRKHSTDVFSWEREPEEVVDLFVKANKKGKATIN